MKKLFLAIIAIVVVAAVVVWQLPSDAQTAPDVQFTTLDGEQFTTQDLRGKVVLVKFWATNCTTCVAQMPSNIENYNNLKDRGYDTIAVAMKYDPPNYVKNFAESRQLPFKVVIDSTGELAQAFGDVRLTPTAFLIDKQGNIIRRYLGNYDKEAFLATVNKALG
ncbi:TlpA disulfide reductase family protein [Achromobacter sp. F4_2707]|uniref:peroxiredoxin family protein n=1 Tax=Achromobacter sp. F4_2707 TaxID=3114286 RepID=UPI0039C656C2